MFCQKSIGTQSLKSIFFEILLFLVNVYLFFLIQQLVISVGACGSSRKQTTKADLLLLICSRPLLADEWITTPLAKYRSILYICSYTAALVAGVVCFVDFSGKFKLTKTTRLFYLGKVVPSNVLLTYDGAQWGAFIRQVSLLVPDESYLILF